MVVLAFVLSGFVKILLQNIILCTLQHAQDFYETAQYVLKIADYLQDKEMSNNIN